MFPFRSESICSGLKGHEGLYLEVDSWWFVKETMLSLLNNGGALYQNAVPLRTKQKIFILIYFFLLWRKTTLSNISGNEKISKTGLQIWNTLLYFGDGGYTLPPFALFRSVNHKFLLWTFWKVSDDDFTQWNVLKIYCSFLLVNSTSLALE